MSKGKNKAQETEYFLAKLDHNDLCKMLVDWMTNDDNSPAIRRYIEQVIDRCNHRFGLFNHLNRDELAVLASLMRYANNEYLESVMTLAWIACEAGIERQHVVVLLRRLRRLEAVQSLTPFWYNAAPDEPVVWRLLSPNLSECGHREYFIQVPKTRKRLRLDESKCHPTVEVMDHVAKWVKDEHLTHVTGTATRCLVAFLASWHTRPGINAVIKEEQLQYMTGLNREQVEAGMDELSSLIQGEIR